MTVIREVARDSGVSTTFELSRANAWHGLSATIARSGSVDRVELKVLLKGPLEGAIAALGLARGAGRRLEVYYLDTPHLDLRGQGILIRARIRSRGRADLVVKLRAPQPRELPRSVARLPKLSLELDALPHRTQWCASLKSRPRRLPPLSDGRSKRRGKGRGWREALSADQRAFLTRLAGDPELVAAIRPFGPVSVRKFTGRVPGLAGVAVESWIYPDGYQLLELSTKCAPEDAYRTAQRLRRLLAVHDLIPRSGQLSKAEISLRRLGR